MGKERVPSSDGIGLKLPSSSRIQGLVSEEDAVGCPSIHHQRMRPIAAAKPTNNACRVTVERPRVNAIPIPKTMAIESTMVAAIDKKKSLSRSFPVMRLRRSRRQMSRQAARQTAQQTTREWWRWQLRLAAPKAPPACRKANAPIPRASQSALLFM